MTQPSGKWEGRPERGPCAQPAPPQHIRTRPILCGHLSPAGLQCGQHRQGPKDPLLTAGLVSAVRLPCPLGGQSHIHGDYVIRDVPLGPTASRKSPLGSSVASMGAGGRESGGKRLLGRRICSRVTLGERAPSLCTQRWTRGPLGPLGGKDIRRGDQSLQTGQRASPAATLRAAVPVLPPARPSQGPPEAADVTTNNPSLCVGVGGGRDRLSSSFWGCAALVSPIQRSQAWETFLGAPWFCRGAFCLGQ